MKLLLRFVPLLLLLLACEKEPLPETINAAALPVIEAYLTAGQAAKVKVSRQLSPEAGDGLELMISGLELTISVDEEPHGLTETSPGVYQAMDLIITSGKVYSLEFDYQGSTVSAYTEVPDRPVNFESSATSITVETSTFPPTLPDPVNLTWQNVAGGYFQVRVENVEDSPELLDFFGGGSEDEEQERPVVTNLPQQADSYELTIREFQYAGTHRIILAEVTTDYVALAQETANADEQNPTTPYTNIVGGTGIFTGIGTDTLYLEVQD